MKKLFTRAEIVAQKVGLTIRTIDFYVSQGLVKATEDPKEPRKARRYSREDIFRMLLVKELVTSGVRIARIQKLMIGIIHEVQNSNFLILFDHDTENPSAIFQDEKEGEDINLKVFSCIGRSLEKALILNLSEINQKTAWAI